MISSAYIYDKTSLMIGCFGVIGNLYESACSCIIYGAKEIWKGKEVDALRMT